MLNIGSKAPGFNLESTKGQVALDDYKGRWLVLFFYPLDFTPICSTEVPEFDKHLAEFEALNTSVIACNTDSIHSHGAWLREIGEVNYPVAADYTKDVSRAYGVLDEEKGLANRGVFIIDPDQNVRYVLISDIAVGRNVKEVIRNIKALQTGSFCPVNWDEGQDTL